MPTIFNKTEELCGRSQSLSYKHLLNVWYYRGKIADENFIEREILVMFSLRCST